MIKPNGNNEQLPICPHCAADPMVFRWHNIEARMGEQIAVMAVVSCAACRKAFSVTTLGFRPAQVVTKDPRIVIPKRM